MKYITIAAIVIACLVAGVVGWPWWQSQQAYNAAEQHINTQHAKRYHYINLTNFPKLRAVPENIRQIENLSVLEFNDTDVSDLSAIANMAELYSLNLRKSKVKDISVLATLPALKSVDMGETPVRDLSPLAASKNLERLDISDTHTITLEPVTRMAKLNWLNLYVADSDDGSQVHFDELMARGNIDIQPGNRFKENYKP